MVSEMMKDDYELISIYYGADISEEQAQELVQEFRRSIHPVT